MYFREIRVNWRQLTAAATGLSLGAALSHYTLGLFGPPLIAEFGWSKADFALIGAAPLLTLPLIPFAGRFTDRFGTRVAAMVGFTAVPLGFLAFTFMSGSIIEFFAIYLAQQVLGVLTTTFVFARVVVERFDRARGIALSIMMTGPPLAGGVTVPLLGELIQNEGWRAGYYALAALSAFGGLLTLLLLGREKQRVRKPASEVRLTRRELGSLIRNRTFLLLLSGMLLVNIPQVFASSQIKLVALDNGLADNAATWMISTYAIGVGVGRIISGFALDRIAAHLVAIGSLGLPALGYVTLSSSYDALWIVTVAMAIVGLAQGAEGDLGAFMVSRHFDMKHYSLLMSIVMGMIGVGGAIGSLILSSTLRLNDSYTPFLLISAVTTIIGALLFFLTGRVKPGPAVSQPLTAGEMV